MRRPAGEYTFPPSQDGAGAAREESRRDKRVRHQRSSPSEIPDVRGSTPVNPGIEIPMDRVAGFCRRNRIRRLALFGSVLRDDFAPESDVDVLVEFEPGARVGLSFFTMQDELSDILGRRVDMNTFDGVEESRNWLLKAEILDSAEVVYDQAR